MIGISVYEEKHRLYKEYLEELEEIRGKRFDATEEERRQWCDDFINSQNYSWKNIWDPDTGNLAGFLIFGKPPECHPGADRFVCQAFVEKGSRGKGLMKDCFLDYESRHHCRYALHLIQKNLNAAEFWEHIFVKTLGYRWLDLPLIPGVLGPGETQVAYEYVPR